LAGKGFMTNTPGNGFQAQGWPRPPRPDNHRGSGPDGIRCGFQALYRPSSTARVSWHSV